MAVWSRKHDVTDIYGIRSRKYPGYRLPDAPETGFRHSGTYHKYFRGYTEIRKTNEKGRVVVERYYTQPWIVSELTGWRYWLCRLLYLCLAAASAGLFFWALCRDIPGTRSVLVAIPGLPSAILLFLQAVITIFYLTAPRRMTLWDHASTSKRLRVIACVTASAQALTALLLASYAVFTGVQLQESLCCAALVMLSALLSFSLFLLEQKMPYGEEPNDTKLPKGEAYEIW